MFLKLMGIDDDCEVIPLPVGRPCRFERRNGSAYIVYWDGQENKEIKLARKAYLCSSEDGKTVDTFKP